MEQPPVASVEDKLNLFFSNNTVAHFRGARGKVAGKTDFQRIEALLGTGDADVVTVPQAWDDDSDLDPNVTPPLIQILQLRRGALDDKTRANMVRRLHLKQCDKQGVTTA